MLKKFYDDIFLYNSIKDVTGWNDDKKIETIWNKLHKQKYWNIQDIEKEMTLEV